MLLAQVGSELIWAVGGCENFLGTAIDKILGIFACTDQTCSKSLRKSDL